MLFIASVHGYDVALCNQTGCQSNIYILPIVKAQI